VQHIQIINKGSQEKSLEQYLTIFWHNVSYHLVKEVKVQYKPCTTTINDRSGKLDFDMLDPEASGSERETG